MPEIMIAKTPADLPDRATLLSMSGMAYMQAMLDGQMPQPTMSPLMGCWLHSAEPGRVCARGIPTFVHTNPFGAVHGGWYGALLDMALGCTVMTMVPQGRWYTTLEYKVNLTRALPLGTEVEAQGIIDHVGRSTAVAHATLRGCADGRIYATGSTTCIILD
ncbi:MAG: PaaI family thioesterase [Paracoccaceae bacterium]|nr:PaaI family thioesterase [Paracoccaceae bacterium]